MTRNQHCVHYITGSPSTNRTRIPKRLGRCTRTLPGGLIRVFVIPFVVGKPHPGYTVAMNVLVHLRQLQVPRDFEVADRQFVGDRVLHDGVRVGVLGGRHVAGPIAQEDVEVNLLPAPAVLGLVIRIDPVAIPRDEGGRVRLFVDAAEGMAELVQYGAAHLSRVAHAPGCDKGRPASWSPRYRECAVRRSPPATRSRRRKW